MLKKSIKDIKVRGKRVIVRVDFNVPMDGNKITDDTRITSSLPTIHNLLGRGAKIVLISHLGRPKGKDMAFSLKPIVERLEELLEMKDIPLLDVEDPNSLEVTKNLHDGQIAMLENIRFYDDERKDWPKFAKILAKFGDVYVNDAFGVCHRAHASVVGIPEYLPAVAGLLLMDEIKFLDIFLKKAAHPVCVIIGGKKASSKIAVIDTFIEKADIVLVGGGCANTFLRSWGYDIGKSISEAEMLNTCKRILWKATRAKTALLIPEDVVVADDIEGTNERVVSIEEVPKNSMILDVGPETIKKFQMNILKASTIIWAGPLGLYENKKFATGTHQVLKAIVESGANSITGGGDTIGAMKQYPELYKQITHISTGGGAMLEYIEKGTLPGIAVLNDL
jgi:phosphoglycerate kinase